MVKEKGKLQDIFLNTSARKMSFLIHLKGTNNCNYWLKNNEYTAVHVLKFNQCKQQRNIDLCFI